MTATVARRGYLDTSVEQVLAGTGLARSTFYDHFADKCDCFLAALDQVGRGVEDELMALAARPQASVEDAIRLMVDSAGADPAAAKLLFVESLAAGPRSLHRRDSLRDRLDAVFGGVLERGDERDDVLDLSPRALAGGLVRLLGMRFGTSEPRLESLAADFLAWTECYRSHRGEADWRVERPVAGVAALSPASTPVLDVPLVPVGGRVRRRELEQAQRLRILQALARCSYGSGYESVTVTDITDTAQVSRKAFYKHFPEKTDAALAADERIFQTSMVAAAAGFFNAGNWAERAWGGGLGLLGFFAANPESANFAFVEAPAIGHRATSLVYERLGAFEVFLEDGYRIRPEAAGRLPRGVGEFIQATMFERGYRELRDTRHAAGLLTGLPSFIYLILAPFMGPQAAGEFVEARIAEVEGG